MQLKARTKNIVVTPSICKGSEDKFSLVFRYPSQVDLLKLADLRDNGQIVAFIDGLFVEFDNKPEILDEDGKAIDFKSFADMMSLGGSEITSVLVDVVEEFQSLKDNAGKTEKKS